MMTIGDAIAKVQKLMRLAKSSNANEAALAAEMAQKLLARYEIDMAALAVDAEDGKPPVDEAIEDFGAFECGGLRLATWKPMLASKVGNVNACKVYTQGSNIGIIGRPGDVAKVKALYALLASEVDRLTKTLARGQGRSYANSFRLGCVAAIGVKLEDAHNKVAAEMRAENTGAALVRIDKALERIADKQRTLDAWLRANTRFSNARRSYSVNGGGYGAGYRAGQSVNVGGNARGALGSGHKRLR